MQDILDEPIVIPDLIIEIRSRHPGVSTSSTDLQGRCLEPVEQSRLLLVCGCPAPPGPEQLAVLADPLIEDVILVPAQGAAPATGWRDAIYVRENAVDAQEGTERHFLDVFCRPGVTDAEGDMAAQALEQTGMAGVSCRAGTRYHFSAAIPMRHRTAIQGRLGNPLIHRFLWSDDVAGRSDFMHGHAAPPAAPVRVVSLTGLGEPALLDISREEGLALDLAEMQAIQSHFAEIGRDPTDVELQSLALTWSEHCSHKTFKATIHLDHAGSQETIDGLLAECIAAPTRALDKPWVHSVFDDNAGIIAFDDDFDLAFKVETHNHPSALEPYGGAHTGVGGVIRDVLAVSAEPIANTDVLCFGPLDLDEAAIPAGALHPRATLRGVVDGIGDYGNNMGIPTVGGAVLFHRRYTANPLVYCGTLGILPAGSHSVGPRPGDAVVLLGGRTGRDGLHGATMSSETLDRESVSTSTVQIGAPITEKVVRDALPQLRDERLYHAITDCGAGGLCSAVGEMGAKLGVEVDLALVPLKYQGLSPWEIWLSEAQERMVLAVPAVNLFRLHQICRAHDVEATVLGRFRDDGMLRLVHGSDTVAELALGFMHGGRPHRTLCARWAPSPESSGVGAAASGFVNSPVGAAPSGHPLGPGRRAGMQARPLPRHGRTEHSRAHATASAQIDPSRRGRNSEPLVDAATSLLQLLAHPNIASKEDIIRRFDHEVQGGTIIKPLVGRAGPSDAAVLRPLRGSWRGAVLAHGINPLYGELDPHAMAMLAVDEALRNLVAVGGSIDHVAMLDNFCWGDVDDPDGLGALVRAAQGCRDAALRYEVPFISGKDSLRNTSADADGTHSIPGTLLISAVGVVNDVRCCVTMNLQAAGSSMYLLGATGDELGGSHFHEIHGLGGGTVPGVRRETPALMRRLTRAIDEQLVLSCHDLSEGGLAVAAAEMALAGGLGLDLDLERVPRSTESIEVILFSESPGRFLLEVADEQAARFEDLFEGLPYACIGRVRADERFIARQAGEVVINLGLPELDTAWRTPLLPPPLPAVPAPRSVDGEEVADRRSRSSTPRAGNARVRALILTAPGINCDGETVEACRMAGADAEPVHLKWLLDDECSLDDFGMLVLPGGFSYGDHLGAGSMLATVLRNRLLPDLLRFVADGRPVLGICNGFQVLARLGLLGPISLARNNTDRFECRWVPLQVEPSPCRFLDGLEDIDLPIAHGQGRVVIPADCLAPLLPLAPLRYRRNPNGSTADIAGIYSPEGNVLGLMPHPERYLTPYHHPDRVKTAPAGLRIFENMIRYVREMP